MKKYILLISICVVVLGATVLTLFQERSLGATVLSVQQGGTGRATFASGQCLKGNGTGGILVGDCGGGATDQLGQIGDVSTSTLAYGHLLMFDGSNWQDTATSSLGITATIPTETYDVYGQATSSVNIHESAYNHSTFITAAGVPAAETDAAHDTCGEISGCVVGAITDGNTNWDNTYNLITLTNLSSTATGLTYTNTTGVFSLTSGYGIPKTASTTNWNNTYNTVAAGSSNWDTAYGWGNHASAGYLTSGGTLTSSNICQYDGSGIDCNLSADGSGDCGAGAVCTGGHTHSSYLTSVGVANMASADFGAFTCNGATCSLDTSYQPAEDTLTDIADGTINENLVNTANPWADNEVADDITASNYLALTVWFATTSAPQLTSLASLQTVGTITSGVWNGTRIDVSDYTNLAAGRSLTLSGDSVEADSELYTSSFEFTVASSTMATTTSVKSFKFLLR